VRRGQHSVGVKPFGTDADQAVTESVSNQLIGVASMRPPGLRGKIEARACEHAAGYKEREQGEAF